MIDVPASGNYRVTFKAKASMNREIRLALEKDGQSPLMDETMSVSGDWTNYSYDLTVSSAASGVKLVLCWAMLAQQKTWPIRYPSTTFPCIKFLKNYRRGSRILSGFCSLIDPNIVYFKDGGKLRGYILRRLQIERPTNGEIYQKVKWLVKWGRVFYALVY